MLVTIYDKRNEPVIINLNSISFIKAVDGFLFAIGESFPHVWVRFDDKHTECIEMESYQDAVEEVKRISKFIKE